MSFELDDTDFFDSATGAAAPATGTTGISHLDDLFGSGGGTTPLSTYARTLCEIEDFQAGLGRDLHAVLRAIPPASWARVKNVIASLARPDVTIEKDWAYVPASERSRAPIKAQNYALTDVTMRLMNKVLALYSDLEYAEGGLYYKSEPICLAEAPIIVKGLPGVAGGLIVMSVDDAMKQMASIYVADWLKKKVTHPVTGAFANGIKFPTRVPITDKIVKSVNAGIPADVLLRDVVAKGESIGLGKVIWEAVMSHPDSSNGLVRVEKESCYWAAPTRESLVTSLKNLVTRFQPLLNECRSCRGEDNVEIERSLWYRHRNVPRPMAEFIMYRELIGSCKNVHFVGATDDIVTAFSGQPANKENEIVIYCEKAYQGITLSDAGDKAFPEAAAWKHLSGSHPAKAAAAISCKLPNSIDGLSRLSKFLRDGWQFYPGVSPHNGYFWLVKGMQGKDPALAIARWAQLGMIVNYLRTLFYVSMQHVAAAKARSALRLLYVEFETHGNLKPLGTIELEDLDFDMEVDKSEVGKRKAAE